MRNLKNEHPLFSMNTVQIKEYFKKHCREFIKMSDKETVRHLEEELQQEKDCRHALLMFITNHHAEMVVKHFKTRDKISEWKKTNYEEEIPDIDLSEHDRNTLSGVYMHAWHLAK